MALTDEQKQKIKTFVQQRLSEGKPPLTEGGRKALAARNERNAARQQQDFLAQQPTANQLEGSCAMEKSGIPVDVQKESDRQQSEQEKLDALLTPEQWTRRTLFADLMNGLISHEEYTARRKDLPS